MKKQLTAEQKLRKIIRQEISLIKEAAFYRLSKKSISGDLYNAMRALDDIYSWCKSGNDFKPKDLDDVIEILQRVKTLAKKFNSEEDVTDEYK